MSALLDGSVRQQVKKQITGNSVITPSDMFATAALAPPLQGAFSQHGRRRLCLWPKVSITTIWDLCPEGGCDAAPSTESKLAQQSCELPHFEILLCPLKVK